MFVQALGQAGWLQSPQAQQAVNRNFSVRFYIVGTVHSFNTKYGILEAEGLVGVLVFGL